MAPHPTAGKHHDNTNWSEISTSSTYTITSAEEGKSIKAIISYEDGYGNQEIVNTMFDNFLS